MDFVFRYVSVLFFLYLLTPGLACAQQRVAINDQKQQHIFTFKEIERLEDPGGNLSFGQVTSPAFNKRFKASATSTPQNTRLNGVYWYRIKIDHHTATDKEWLLEFFDQTIDHITAYLPNGKGGYTIKRLGDAEDFRSREVKHKNFEIPIKQFNGEGVYYFRTMSHQTADIIVV